MTVLSTDNRTPATGTGAVTAFDFDFKYFNASDIVVTVSGAVISPTLYTLTQNSDGNGGTVVFITAPAAAAPILIYRDLPYTQETVIPVADRFSPEILEDAYDKNTMLIQQVKEITGRSVVRALTSTSTADLTLPEPSAGKAILWNSGGTGLINSTDEFNDIVTNATTQAAAASASASAASGSAITASGAAISASASASAASVSAVAAAVAAGSVTLPSAAGNGTKYIRQKSDESGFEYRTQAQTQTDLGITSPFSTGDLKQSYATSSTGWVLLNGGTIGDGSSGATRANADTSALFTLLWTNLTNTELPILDSAGSGSTRGASAAADFAAHKRLPVPDARGRTVIGLDNMGGSAASRITSASVNGANSTTLGAAGGAQTHTLLIAESPAHDHSGLTGTAGSTAGGSTRPAMSDASNVAVAGIPSKGGDGAHSNTQPWITANTFIKL